MNADSDHILDCRGELCPVPVARTRAWLRRCASGQAVAVWCTDPLAPLDIEALCQREGHDWLGCVSDSSGHLCIHIRAAVRA